MITSALALPVGAVLDVGNRGEFGTGIVPGQVIDNLRVYNAEMDPPPAEAAQDFPMVAGLAPPAPRIDAPAPDETVFWGGAVEGTWRIR